MDQNQTGKAHIVSFSRFGFGHFKLNTTVIWLIAAKYQAYYQFAMEFSY